MGFLMNLILLKNINKINDERNTNLIKTAEKWSQSFEFVQSESISLENIHTIFYFSLAIPGTPGDTEGVFSITLYDTKKNRFLV
jgi:hypothetical protein